MKRILLGLFVLVAGLTLVACGGNDPLPNETKSFWVTGQFAGWGDAPGNDDYLMEAAAPRDERLKSVRKEILKAEWLVVAEITLPEDEAGWEKTYKIDGKEVIVDGNLTFKIIQTAKNDEEHIPEWWAQSPESGQLHNLTPDTLYVPPFIEENVDQAGGWNDNPIAFEAGDYVAFLARVDGKLVVGLIKQ